MQVNQQVIQSYLNQRNYHHTTMVRHRGQVIVFAMDAARRIAFTILDSREDGYAHDWLVVQARLEQMVPLAFPAAFVRVRHGAGEATRLPTVQDPFLSSTARFTADAPFQALSDGDDVYLFRQSLAADHTDMVPAEVEGRTMPLVDNTLLLDRYVAAGATLQLKRTATDHAQEPTSVLDFVRHLQAGRFTVMLLPTREAATKRWQIFAYNGTTQQIDAFNVKRAADGRFDTTVAPGYGSPSEATGAAESALQFTTNDCYVDCGAGIDLRETDFTIELWARCTTPEGGNQVALAQGQGDESSSVLQIGFRDTNQFTFAFAADDSLSTQRRFRDRDWHHWTCIYTHAERRRQIYYDGARVIGNTAKAPYSGGGLFLIGKAPQGRGWRGDIDEVRVWKRARSAEDIQHDRSHRLVGDEAGLVAYWRFDEGAGDTTHDRTENAHHGTLHGNTNNAMWVTSSAPVRVHPGLDRSSFALAGRQIASGLSALHYTLQGGTQNETTPASARVMVAVGTGSSNSDGPHTSPQAIVVVDFAVSPEGTLGQIPDILSPPVATGGAAALVAQLRHHAQSAQELLAHFTEGFVEQAQLTASNIQVHAYFGGAVAINGEWALIGAHEESPDGIDHAGSVAVFHRENGVWVPRQVLTASDREAEAHFGIAVALHGEWALVGAHEASPSGVEYAGSVSVFHRENGVWVPRQVLTASDREAEAHFGIAVALHGEWALIGADTAAADGVAQAGKAYVFQREADDTWGQQAILTAGTQQAHTGFGSAIALHGEWALIGAYGARADGIADAGSVYVYRRDGTTWGASQTLTAHAPQAKAYFGGAVAIAGDWILIGADGADIGSATHAGRAEIFHYQDGTWVHHLSLAPSAPQAHAGFGRAVALGDMWAVVGADGEAADGNARAGSAYIFQRLQGTWVEKQHLLPSALQAHAAFGHAVALHGDTALVGASRYTSEGGAQAGRIAVFEAFLTNRVAEVTQLQATMQHLHAQLADIAQPMPWLHTAPSGLTLYGGVLEGAPVEDPPALMDGATGSPLWPGLIWQGRAGMSAEVEQRWAFGKA
jgi:hypothetical protein